MTLPYRLALRFFKLFDLLCIYAHRRLQVVSDDEFFDDHVAAGISEAGERLTTDELWKHLDVVEDYVRENPDGLSAKDLARVQSWTNAYTDIVYIAKCPDGVLRFLLDEYAIEVSGMSKDIAASLPRLPVLARTTLLPFDDYVVYDRMLEQLPFDPPDEMLEVFQEDLDKALAEGRVIRTGQEFCDAVPGIRKRRTEARIEQFRHEIEMEERANGPLPGQHRGVLAGLSPEDREEAIHRHMRSRHKDAYETEFSYRASQVDESCLPGDPVFSLQELVKAHTRVSCDLLEESTDSLIEELQTQGDTDSDSLTRALELKEAFRAGMVFDEMEKATLATVSGADKLQSIINNLVAPQIKRMRKLAQDGGYRTCPDNPTPSPDLVPVPVAGLCYLFHTDGTYHVVMPKEVVPIARELDWDQALSNAHYVRRVADFFECVSDLRGIVEIESALDEFVANFDDGSHTPDEVYDTLLDCMEDEQVASTLLETEEGTYLLHYELFAMYQDNRGKDSYADSIIFEGPMTELLRGLLDKQAGREPRPITEEMLSFGSGFQWKRAQPPALAMQAFLDEHVPDGADDYFYADGVMEELLMEQMLGIVQGSIDYFFQVLEEMGFVPDESQMQPLLTLWQNFNNGLPIWPNNGWSPNELAAKLERGQRAGERPVFYNADGSVMKVGRNDPCPCGSGKKYKHCCGR